jgi:hypothetical protein
MIPDISKNLHITRQELTWIDPPYQINYEDKSGAYCGFPLVPVFEQSGPTGLKLAYHHPGELPIDFFECKRFQHKC